LATQPRATALIAAPAFGLVVAISVSVGAGVVSKARLPRPALPDARGALLADQRKPKNNAQLGNASANRIRKSLLCASRWMAEQSSNL